MSRLHHLCLMWGASNATTWKDALLWLKAIWWPSFPHTVEFAHTKHPISHFFGFRCSKFWEANKNNSVRMSTCNRTSSDNQRHCNILKLQLDRLLRLLRQFERDQVSQGHTCECPPYGHEKPNPTDCKIQKLQQFVKLAAQSSTLLKRMISLPQEGAQGKIGFILT